MKKILSLALSIFILMAAFFNIVGCDGRYKKGTFNYAFRTRSYIRLGVRSNKDVFSLDDVTLDLYYGFHDLKNKRKDNYHPSDLYYGINYDKALFILYVCDIPYLSTIYKREQLEDENNEKLIFIKEITQNDAFSDDYGYKVNLISGTKYNHSERLTVPTELFSNSRGGFGIVLALLLGQSSKEEFEDEFYAKECINLTYNKIDEDNIKIFF